MLSAVIFCLGLLIIIIKRNAIFVLIGIELILNAANINLVVYNSAHASLDGEMFGLFVVVLAAAEASIALAILLNVHKHYQSRNLEKLNRHKY
jgi:NADH-quinone oxidoreductase subunit K